MTKNENTGLGLALVALCIVQLTFSIIALISTIIAEILKTPLDKSLAYMGYKSVPLNEALIYIAALFVIIISIKYILSRNLLALLIYFISSILYFIYSLNVIGVKIDTILPVIFPILMAVFVFSRKSTFRKA